MLRHPLFGVLSPMDCLSVTTTYLPSTTGALLKHYQDNTHWNLPLSHPEETLKKIGEGISTLAITTLFAHAVSEEEEWVQSAEVSFIRLTSVHVRGS